MPCPALQQIDIARVGGAGIADFHRQRDQLVQIGVRSAPQAYRLAHPFHVPGEPQNVCSSADVVAVDFSAQQSFTHLLGVGGGTVQGQPGQPVPEGNLQRLAELLVRLFIALGGVAIQVEDGVFLGFGPSALACHDDARARQQVNARGCQQQLQTNGQHKRPGAGQETACLAPDDHGWVRRNGQ